CFAISSSDELGNRSAISNVAATRTGGYPVMTVSPTMLGSAATNAGSATETITIGNAGHAVLHWSVGAPRNPSSGRVAPEDVGGWISADPPGGSLAPGRSTEVRLRLDGNGLAAGLYSGSVTVAGNDPASSSKGVAVTLDVRAVLDIH